MFVLFVHIDVLVLKKYFQAVHFAPIRLTQRKDLLLFPPTTATTKKDRKRPGGPLRWIPCVPSQGKEPSALLSSLSPPSPSAPPRSVANKMDGLPSFFPWNKKEVFVALTWTQSYSLALRATFQGVQNKPATQKDSQDAPPTHYGGGGEEGRKGYRDIGCGRLLLRAQSLTNILGSFFRHQVFHSFTAQNSAVRPSLSSFFTSMSSC